MHGADGWIDQLLNLPRDYKAGSKSIRQLITEIDPPHLDSADLARQVAERLRRSPELIDAWQVYSYDRRTRPTPYLDGLEVGFFDGESRDVAEHDNTVDACADFVVRETQWLLSLRDTP
ncbi:hypothetical protein [Streptomyces sp. NPDC093591]|uniref:hypothetical protein n=1 Tax=Streptomyces sp. NPDC093591 TaxID=3366044 RepID=UPI00381542FC